MRAALAVSRVAPRGQPVDRAWLETAATLSFLRFGGDTRACRLFLELVRQPALPGASTLVERLAAALDIPPAERTAHIRRAEQIAARALVDAADRGLIGIPIGADGLPGLAAADCRIRRSCSGRRRPRLRWRGQRLRSSDRAPRHRRDSPSRARSGASSPRGIGRRERPGARRRRRRARGALEAGGGTVAVLGLRRRRVYPAEHRELAARILERGAIVSEFPPGTPPLAHHFPLRNRIISGLSRGGRGRRGRAKSGSLITARRPSSRAGTCSRCRAGLLSGRHRGCHALIKDGARLVETVDDVLEELGWTVRPPAPPAQPTKSLQIQ